MYAPDLRSTPASIRLLDVPSTWSLRDTHVLGSASAGKVNRSGRRSRRTTTPWWIVRLMLGSLQHYSFQQDGATYHIVVHGNPATTIAWACKTLCSASRMPPWTGCRTARTIEYTFLYDFPRGPGSGGMEHAYGTAISANAASGKVDLDALAGISAHEFFHLWNVKRIRPQSLEPIDYQHQAGHSGAVVQRGRHQHGQRVDAGPRRTDRRAAIPRRSRLADHRTGKPSGPHLAVRRRTQASTPGWRATLSIALRSAASATTTRAKSWACCWTCASAS